MNVNPVGIAVGVLHSRLTGSHQQTSKVLLDGVLFQQGVIFKDWVKRHCELTEDSINCFASKGGMKVGQINLLPSTNFTDANLRHFCFSLSNHSTGEVVYFAAESSASKETWKEFIITQLSLIQKSYHRRARGRHTLTSESEEIRNNYLARPIIYIKVIRARNLAVKDIGGSSDPFVEISVGSSKEKTTTRKKTLDPEWGMVFKFDWDTRDRYAKVEVWDEDTLSSNDFMGCVLIPLFSLRDGHSGVSWYPLCKRSSKSTISGEIEIEICCERMSGVDQYVDTLFREASQLPEMCFKMLPNPRDCDENEADNVSWSSLREARGFPFYFPPCETEDLEDISIGATLVAQTNLGKISSPGVLMLTNYRLIFISRMRLLAGAELSRNLLLKESDLSCQIPIGTIVDVSMVSDTDQIALNNSSENLFVKTIDGKSLTFVFGFDEVPEASASGRVEPSVATISSRISGKDFQIAAASSSTKDSPSLDLHTKLNGKKTTQGISARVLAAGGTWSSDLDGDGGGGVFHQPTVSAGRISGKLGMDSRPGDGGCLETVLPGGRLKKVGLAQAWEAVCRNCSLFQVDALDSEEGGPAARMYTRIYHRRVSRFSDRIMNLRLNSPLLDLLSSACVVQSPDSESRQESARVPLGSSETLSADQSPGSELDQLSLSRRYFTTETLEHRILTDSSIHERATIFSSLENGWYIYDAMAEFSRMGIPDAHWRISEANVRYELCPTYPALTVVPQSVDDVTLSTAAQFRSKCRYPTLAWRNPTNLCSIVRCSQPLVGISFQRSEQDEYLLAEVSKCSGGITRTSVRITDGIHAFASSSRKPYVIADARPQLNAVANQAAGKGVENDKFYENSNIMFLGIPNIHAVRKSLEMIDDACADELAFATKVEASGWLSNIMKILKGVMRIVHCVGFEDLSVVVHCSDGWDRTAQLTSLSMLLLDGYYRTTKGFMVLIEKEWCSFGHKFSDRCGWSYEGWKDDERSPIFHQFLDCVFQCLNQIPEAFEFNEDLLLFILEHLQSGWFGDFMFNCEKEKREYKSYFGAVSIWAVVLHDISCFKNSHYRPTSGPILPVIRAGKIVVWSRWFHKWNDRLWRAAWLQEYSIDEPDEGNSKTWIDDKSVTGCRRCQKLFSLARRRHHCRRCGYIFCDKCTGENRIVASVSNWRPSRVCAECAIIIDRAKDEDSGPSRPMSHQSQRADSSSDSPRPMHPSRSEPSLVRTTIDESSAVVGERVEESGEVIDDWNGSY